MKIVKMKHRIEKFHDGHHLHVHGLLKTDEGVHLPFYYKLDPTQEFDHEAYLSELGRQGSDYFRVDGELRSWVDDEFDIGTIHVKIADCQLMFLGHSRWKLYVDWWETVGGWTELVKWEAECKTPAEAIPLEQVKILVRQKTASSHETYQKALAHMETLKNAFPESAAV